MDPAVAELLIVDGRPFFSGIERWSLIITRTGNKMRQVAERN
jgi:hypothetical protein